MYRLLLVRRAVKKTVQISTLHWWNFKIVRFNHSETSFHFYNVCTPIRSELSNHFKNVQISDLSELSWNFKTFTHLTSSWPLSGILKFHLTASLFPPRRWLGTHLRTLTLSMYTIFNMHSCTQDIVCIYDYLPLKS